MKKSGQIEPEVLFPLIVCSSRGIVSASYSERSFTKWTKSVAKDKNYYKSLTLIDSRGGVYIVDDLVIVGYSNPFLGFDLFFNQSVCVNIKLKKQVLFSLEKLKKIAIKLARSNEDYYISGGISLTAIIAAINEATDKDEVISSLNL